MWYLKVQLENCVRKLKVVKPANFKIKQRWERIRLLHPDIFPSCKLSAFSEGLLQNNSFPRSQPIFLQSSFFYSDYLGRTMIMGVEGSFPPGLTFSLWQFVAEKYSNTLWMFLSFKTFSELLIPGFYPAAFWTYINSQDSQRILWVNQEIHEDM